MGKVIEMEDYWRCLRCNTANANWRDKCWNCGVKRGEID